MSDSFKIDSIESLYTALEYRDEIKDQALMMLMVRTWLTEVSDFDPVSGRSLQTSSDGFMNRVAKVGQFKTYEYDVKDRIFRIVSHTKDAVIGILEHTRNKILREHAMLPIHSAREVDSSSVQWLSRQPGRTLREKLSGKPYIKAVNRRASVDTAENRLFKAFLCRLEVILMGRQDVLPVGREGICEELLVTIQRWLRSENACEIGEWENLPPNNTLLQDKRYRKIWDGWIQIQNIDEFITEDSKRVQRDFLNVIYWNTLSLLHQSGRFRAVQQPISVDYDKFSISPKLPMNGYLYPIHNTKAKGKIRNINYEKKFGFLISEKGTHLFFHNSNLSGDLDVSLLKAGDEVSFVIGSNKQGECADDITFLTGAIQLNFHISGELWKIEYGKDKYSLKFVGDYLVIEQATGIKKKLRINPETYKELSIQILSVITEITFENSESSNSLSRSGRMSSSIIDLCSIRPTFINNKGLITSLPFRLLQQVWSLNDSTSALIDCCDSKSIALQPNIETVSMRSLTTHCSTLTDEDRSKASMFFIKKLSDYISADKLTYLVPDWINDFDLEGIRKSINFSFDESTPLPKSIAAIFAWQSSKNFKQNKVQENDLVLIITSIDDYISLTPIQVKYQEKLGELIPESQGISWIRHPAIAIPNKKIQSSIIKKLKQDGCHAADELLNLFGLDGLFNDAGEVSFVKDESWYSLPSSLKDTLTSNQGLNVLSYDDIDKCINSVNRSCLGGNVYLLPLENTIKKTESRNRYKWLGSELLPIKGCQVLNKWEEKAEGLALWNDHLPELSIKIVRDGRFENFYLVKNATITPQRGRIVEIPVEELFTLPAGQSHYSFPLQQGEGNRELQFVAYLKSSAFPLKEAVTCKLKMTYTYGADEPYILKFVPLDSRSAGFNSITVEWRSFSESRSKDIKDLPVPGFPIRKSWLDFQKFPKEDGKNFSDLLDWVKRDLTKVSEISEHGRISGKIPKWIDKGHDNIFCFIDNVFIHKSALRLKSGNDFPIDGTELSFYKVKDSKGKYSAEDITNGKELPLSCFLSKSLRFPTLTIWNNGHSLTESDVPEHFRNAIFESIPNILSIIESENMPDSLKEELFFFLCCLHKDAPGIVGFRLLNAVKDKKLLRKYYKNIALAIGNAELPYQQQLLKSIINPIDNEGLTKSITMEVLSITFWRSSELINQLHYEELKELNISLYSCLEFDLQKVISGGKTYQIATLCKHLELLLALLRSRISNDENIRNLFAPNKELTRKYVALIEDISRVVIDNNYALNSRINLRVDKPEMFRSSPNLLYALRMYLTGELGANVIYITSIQDD